MIGDLPVEARNDNLLNPSPDQPAREMVIEYEVLVAVRTNRLHLLGEGSGK
jgi:hypothetical protein